jgi:hypothetical protein
MKQGSTWAIFSFRFSERVATTIGPVLTKCELVDRSASNTVRDILWKKSKPIELSSNKDPAKATGLTHAFMQLFRNTYRWGCAGECGDAPLVTIEQSGGGVICKARRFFTFYSSEEEVDQSEGDDLLVLVVFDAFESAESPAKPTVLLSESGPDRLRAQTEGWEKLRSVLGIESSPVNFREELRLGFQLLDGPSFSENIKGGEDGFALVAAQLFYCYLLCQRMERMLFRSVSDENYDKEYRQYLLLRRKFSAASKRVKLTNRAYPHSVLLQLYHNLVVRFRLKEQISQIEETLDAVGRELDARTMYVSGQRLKALQVIAAAGAGMGVGVSLNTIQMWPFFGVATENVLRKPIFWVTFLVIFGFSYALWRISIKYFERGIRR